MSSIGLIISIAGVFLGLEVLFFIYCFRWLTAGKRQREKDFKIIDTERTELLDLQHSLRQDLSEAKLLSDSTLSKLNKIGAEANNEWNDMLEKMQGVSEEIELQMRALLNENLGTLSKQKLALEKSAQDGQDVGNKLLEAIAAGQKMLRLFNKNVPAEEIMKELQVEKYTEAKKMLANGIDPAAISRKLSLSTGELSLLSFMRK